MIKRLFRIAALAIFGGAMISSSLLAMDENKIEEKKEIKLEEKKEKKIKISELLIKKVEDGGDGKIKISFANGLNEKLEEKKKQQEEEDKKLRELAKLAQIEKDKIIQFLTTEGCFNKISSDEDKKVVLKKKKLDRYKNKNLKQLQEKRKDVIQKKNELVQKLNKEFKSEEQRQGLQNATLSELRRVSDKLDEINKSVIKSALSIINIKDRSLMFYTIVFIVSALIALGDAALFALQYVCDKRLLTLCVTLATTNGFLSKCGIVMDASNKIERLPIETITHPFFKFVRMVIDALSKSETWLRNSWLNIFKESKMQKTLILAQGGTLAGSLFVAVVSGLIVFSKVFKNVKHRIYLYGKLKKSESTLTNYVTSLKNKDVEKK